eukprot:TRINITY_DN46170_c0_g1_i1.p1 TRINITY_DN46170_c0_g1~~TRINITY_DN46170_c0_g1_i1.p1  ORF type:complete len:272 (+),score=41.17 TRINITY_DN46170_c0_g1_i1:69-884(+)
MPTTRRSAVVVLVSACFVLGLRYDQPGSEFPNLQDYHECQWEPADKLPRCMLDWFVQISPHEAKFTEKSWNETRLAPFSKEQWAKRVGDIVDECWLDSAHMNIIEKDTQNEWSLRTQHYDAESIKTHFIDFKQKQPETDWRVEAIAKCSIGPEKDLIHAAWQCKGCWGYGNCAEGRLIFTMEEGRIKQEDFRCDVVDSDANAAKKAFSDFDIQRDVAYTRTETPPLKVVSDEDASSEVNSAAEEEDLPSSQTQKQEGDTAAGEAGKKRPPC